MGEPRRLNRQYDVPRKLWDKRKIIADKKLIKDFGLKSKKEIWKAETKVRTLRKIARNLLAGNIDNYENRSKEILEKLVNLGIFTKDHKLEDVLKLQSLDFLERRLQTQVLRKGLSLSANQARQLIIHKHIAVNGKVRSAPSSLVTINDTISYSNSKIKNIIDKQIESKGKSNKVLDKENKNSKENKENKENLNTDNKENNNNGNKE